MAHTTVDLTSDDFDETVAANETVLVDFWASWCGPCVRFAPVYAEVAQAYPDVIFAKVNTEEQEALSSRFNISSIPTLIAFRHGHAIARQVGAVPKAALESLANSVTKVGPDEALLRADARKATEDGTPPVGLPPGVTWHAEDQEWALPPAKGAEGTWLYWRADGTKVAECAWKNGVVHGHFRRFHETGEVSQEGSYHEGTFDGVRRFFACDGFSTEQFGSGDTHLSVKKIEILYEAGRVVRTTYFDGQGRLVLPQSGDLYPERPAGVSEKATYVESLGRWVRAALDQDGARDGVVREWTADGVYIGESHYVHGVHQGPRAMYVKDGMRDARAVFVEGSYEKDSPVGTWVILDEKREPIGSLDLGIRRTNADLAMSGVFDNEPRNANAWWEHANESLGKRHMIDAVLGLARAVATARDVEGLQQFLTRVALVRTEGSSLEIATVARQRAEESPVDLAAAMLIGGDAAELLRSIAIFLDRHGRPRAALDYISAAMILAPHRAEYHFNRTLILAALGLSEQAAEDAKRLAAHQQDQSEFLSRYVRAVFRPFAFVPDAEPLEPMSGSEPALTNPIRSAHDVNVVLQKYATRLTLARKQVLRTVREDPRLEWIPPDLSMMLPNGLVTLERNVEEVEDDDGEMVEQGIDETIDLADVPLPRVLRTAHSDWAGICWLSWALGRARPELADGIHAPKTLAAARLTIERRLDRVRDGEGPSFSWAGFVFDELPPQLVSMVDAEYAEAWAALSWLVDADIRSPWER